MIKKIFLIQNNHPIIIPSFLFFATFLTKRINEK